MKTIALYNNKGGVGKTTSTINIAASLCVKGYKCLTVDLDSQGCLSEFLIGSKYIETSENGSWDIFSFDRYLEQPFKEEYLIYPTSYRYYDPKTKTRPEMFFDVIVATGGLAEVTIKDVNCLKNVLQNFDETYDFCFIDMPPANADITYVGLCASDYLLTPCKADRFSAAAVKNVKQIYANCLTINKNLKFAGAFLADVDTRFGVAKWIKENYAASDNIFFKSFVQHLACFDEAALMGVPVICLTEAKKGIADYKNVAEELLLRL